MGVKRRSGMLTLASVELAFAFVGECACDELKQLPEIVVNILLII